MTIIAVLVTVSVFSAVALVLWREPLTNFLGADIFKITYQFSLLTVLGGAVSYLFRELSREREEREKQQADFVARREAARSVLCQYNLELAAVFNEVLDVTTLARGKGLVNLHSEGGGGRVPFNLERDLGFRFQLDKTETETPRIEFPELLDGRLVRGVRIHCHASRPPCAAMPSSSSRQSKTSSQVLQRCCCEGTRRLVPSPSGRPAHP